MKALNINENTEIIRLFNSNQYRIIYKMFPILDLIVINEVYHF